MALKKGLGKGLDALFSDNTLDVSVDSPVLTININEIDTRKDQPRKDFDKEALESLSDSVKKYGIISPLVVTKAEDGRYKLIAGERRYRAARMAGIVDIPVIIRQSTDSEIHELALIENLQREDLNPIEEASGYKMLMDKFQMTQEEVAKRVSKSRPVIANALRLLGLPGEVMEMVFDGRLSQGHARAILSAESPQDMIDIANSVLLYGWSVRQVEDAVKKQKASPKTSVKTTKLSYLGDFEKSLSQNLGRKVSIKEKGDKGSVTIEYYSADDFEALIKILDKPERN